jgi:3-phosphoshikimate 1-carboxyvinyltransferase
MKRIGPSDIKGAIKAPPSKSVMIRAVAASLLADGTSILGNPSYSVDSLAALHIARTLGADISIEDSPKRDSYITIRGTRGLAERQIRGQVLECGESGLCMRMFAPIAGLLDRDIQLEAKGSLVERPVGMVEALSIMGVAVMTSQGLPPVKIKGPIRPGRYEIDGTKTSQFLTGLLMALPVCNGDSEIRVKGLKSRPYIRVTIDVMKRFGVEVLSEEDLSSLYIEGGQGYRATDYSVEGDWSGTSFMLVAGAIAGSITVYGLDMGSYQADKAIIDVLQKAGAMVAMDKDRIRVTKAELMAFEVCAEDSPDLVPPVVALAAHCRGRSVIHGIKRLRYKESNRIEALVAEFSKMGVGIKAFEDRLEIIGGRVRSSVIDPHNDHRIAMACAVAALRGEGDVMIQDHWCVSKSYPRFFYDLASCMEGR